MLSLSILLLFSLAGTFCLTALNTSWRRLRASEFLKLTEEKRVSFFYLPIHRIFFPKQGYEGVRFAGSCAKNILQFIYTIASVFMVSYLLLLSPAAHISQPLGIVYLFLLFVTLFLFGDYLPRILGMRYPLVAIRLSGFFASFCMLLILPITLLFLKISGLFTRSIYYDAPQEPLKQEIIEMIEESSLSMQLDPHDKKLFEAVMRFKDRITREVMVPRVTLFSLPADMPIYAAAKIIQSEGYSRIPIYQDTNDNMVGILMYKDVIAKYMDYVSHGNDPLVLEAPIRTLMKSVLYTPETKKISQLLQEFRKKQVHIAIVVDEYGGTEGIITIEDILEEIVGDIADEYDELPAPFIKFSEGSWIIDAQANILDIEEQLNVAIPHSGDYDTIGGYIFHQTGMIPPKGFILKEKDFEIEVLNSDERRVEKVRFQIHNSPYAKLE